MEHKIQNRQNQTSRANRPMQLKRLTPESASDAGEANFTKKHVKNYRATNYRSKLCKISGHPENFCKKKFSQRHKEIVLRLKAKCNAQRMRRVKHIEES